MISTKSIKSVRHLAYLALSRIEGDFAYSDIILANIFEQQFLNEKDRAFINELVRGTIRWKKNLDWILLQLLKEPEKVPVQVKWILWLGLYQIIFMSKTPDFAAVNESVELVKRLKYMKWVRLVNGVLRTYLRNPQQIKYPDPKREPGKYLSVVKSHPEWLIERWIYQFGFEQTVKLCDAFNKPPVITVRPNILKISIAEFEEILNENLFIFKRSKVKDYYRLDKINPEKYHQLLQDGIITVQDESAGLVSLLAVPKQNQIVCDLCSAPGGKSVHLAELARDRITIISGDVNFSRIKLVKNAKKRLELVSIKPIVADAHNFPVNAVDLVILDAPCSGLGVLSNKPDLRWQRKQDSIKQLVKLQKELLKKAAQLVKNKGHLVYSTCTIDNEENEGVILNFIEQNPSFTISEPETTVIPKEFITKDKAIRTWPHIHNMDGSFAVKLQKK